MAHPTATTLAQIRRELNASFFERGPIIESMLLALVAGEHWFGVGLPGVGKSQLVRALVGAIDGASYFEVALSKTRPAEAVLGPLDIKRFREDGEYRLKRSGFATDVDIAFFDEIGKMSPVLGHDLLALLNERIYHEVNGGRSIHRAPLHTAFTASNEMPTNESDDAAALWDRLLVRVIVDDLKDDRNFAALMTSDVPNPTTQVKFADLLDVSHNVLPTIAVPDVLVESLVKLRRQFREEHLYPSTRRWKWSMKILQASAFLAGRDEVLEDDLAALRFTLWDTPEQVEKVEGLCLGAANPYVTELVEVRELLNDLQVGMDQRKDSDISAKQEYGKEANQKAMTIRTRLDQILTNANGRQIPGFKAASDRHLELTRRIFREYIDTPDDVVDIVVQKRVGLGDGGQES